MFEERHLFWRSALPFLHMKGPTVEASTRERDSMWETGRLVAYYEAHGGQMEPNTEASWAMIPDMFRYLVTSYRKRVSSPAKVRAFGSCALRFGVITRGLEICRA